MSQTDHFQEIAQRADNPDFYYDNPSVAVSDIQYLVEMVKTLTGQSPTPTPQ